MTKQARVVIEWKDDYDGSQADETIHFGLDGIEYEIDVNELHAKEIRDAMAGVIEHARKVKASKKKNTRDETKYDRPASTEWNMRVRDWSAERGRPLNRFGKIPLEIRAGYIAEHPDDLPVDG